MNLLEMQSRVLRRSDDDTAAPESYTVAQVDAALNEGLLFFVLLTLGLERTVTFPLIADVNVYAMLATYSDWLVPLRILSGGAKVKPERLGSLAALDPAWRTVSGAVEKYAHLGFDCLCLYRKPTGGSLTITYAASPAPLVLDADVPEIPVEYHPALVRYAIYRLRFGFGGQEFQAGLPLLKDFLGSAASLAGLVRTRSLGLRYDKLPFELEKFDVSRLVSIRKDLLPARKEAPEWASQ